MSSNVALGLVVLALVAMMIGRRLRFPFAELVGVLTVGLLLSLGLAGGRPTLVVIGLLVPLPLFGIRIPFVSDGGDRRSEQAPQLTGGEARAAEAARYVNGLLASRWPRGELDLTADLLRFVTEDGDEVFRVRPDAIDHVRFGSLGRAQLTIDTRDGDRHAIAFGHRGLGRGEVGAAQTFWRNAIKESRA